MRQTRIGPVDPAELARLHEVLEYNPDTGAFKWRPGVVRKGRPTRKEIGADRVGSPTTYKRYLQVSIDGRRYLLHRVAFALMTGEWPNIVDHIDGKGGNNRWKNLRNVSRAENAHNLQGPGAGNTTGYLGVSWHVRTGKFVSGLLVNGKRKNLGSFDCPAEAHAAYLAAKRQHHPGNTL